MESLQFIYITFIRQQSDKRNEHILHQQKHKNVIVQNKSVNLNSSIVAKSALKINDVDIAYTL